MLLALLLCATALAEGTDMKYDFSGFTHVTLMGIDISTLNEDELSPLYQVARYCHDIGFVAFSPIARGLLSGRITPQAKFESYDDVRNWVPQLSRANIRGNQPIVDLLKQYAVMKDATPAQISLAWMLHKYPNVVPIPGSRNMVCL